MYHLSIISTELLAAFVEACDDLANAFDALHDAELSTDTFSFYTSVASVYSSKIEGEPIELDSYIKYKRFDIAFDPDYTRKTDDLYAAYMLAQQHPLTAEHLAQAHILLSKHLLPAHHQGKYRHQNMFVTTSDGRIEYVAAATQIVPQAMEALWADITQLLNRSLTIAEVFYFGAFIHLVFVKIHPWNDGNGRTARLLEKWFIAHHLGQKVWWLQSEKNYYDQHATYYQFIRQLGLEYDSLDYGKALPFLRMTVDFLIMNYRYKL
jgi:Fic family protein